MSQIETTFLQIKKYFNAEMIDLGLNSAWLTRNVLMKFGMYREH